MASQKLTMQWVEATGRLKQKKPRNGKNLSRLISYQKDVASLCLQLSSLLRDIPLDALTVMGWSVALNMSLTALWELDLYLMTVIEQLECQPIYGKKPKKVKVKSKSK